MAHALFGSIMNYSSKNPKWVNRDRFVLSNGHACALLYTMLHLTGYKVSMDDLKQFRQLGSLTPGHPESHHTEGIEVTTGPLGQGISNAVGMAMAAKHMAAEYNRDDFDIINHSVYVICGDGCLQEGVSSEASSLAGHLKLGNLIVLYDDNLITIDGDTSLSFTEDVAARYEAYGWQVLTVGDGNSGCADILSAVAEAQAETEKPTIIKVRTTIGLGSAKEGTHGVHGAPLGDADLAQVKERFGFDPEQSFVVPEEVSAFFSARQEQLDGVFAEWSSKFAAYAEAHPQLAADLTRRLNGELPEGWLQALPSYAVGDKTKASRAYSGECLNAVAPLIPELVGGSADLTPSNNTWLKCSHDYQADTPDGRYFRFGVREHGMAAICNGMAAYGGLRPYCATFLNFLGYAMGAVRLSALSHYPVVYVFTHDSIALGEDGPTHQPVETLAQARSLPGLTVIRPADGNETAGAYACALGNSGGPTLLALSRQGLPNLTPPFDPLQPSPVSKGAYVLSNSAEGTPDVCLVASGSELSLCATAAAAVEGFNVRVVSMPCWELFEDQSKEYQDSVFLPGVPVLSVEAGSTMGWSKYAHASIGMTGYGASGKGAEVYASFGFTPDNVAAKAAQLAQLFPGATAPVRVTLQ